MRHEFLLALERAAASAAAPAGRLVICCSRRGWRARARCPCTGRPIRGASSCSTGAGHAHTRRPACRYYPKLVSMTPFTPAPALACSCEDAGSRRERMATALLDHARAQRRRPRHTCCSSRDEDRAALELARLSSGARTASSTGTTATTRRSMTSWRRSARRSARRRCASAGGCRRTASRSARCAGDEMEPRLWDIVFAFSADTFAVRGHEHYLNAVLQRSVGRAARSGDGQAR